MNEPTLEKMEKARVDNEALQRQLAIAKEALVHAQDVLFVCSNINDLDSIIDQTDKAIADDATKAHNKVSDVIIQLNQKEGEE